MATEQTDPIITVKLQDGLADRHRLPLNHVISVLEEVRSMVTEAGREIQRERGLEKPTDFGLELLAEEGDIIFKVGSVEASIAITTNVQDGFLAAQKIVNTVERLRKEQERKTPKEDYDVHIIRRLNRIARIQKIDKTKLNLSVRAPRNGHEPTPDYSALFDQVAIDSVRSMQAPTFSIEPMTIYGKLMQLRDKDEEEESGRGFWGEVLREGGESWRVQFKASDVDVAARLFRHQVSIFLAIFNGEKNGPDIRALLKELKKDKVKIQTSIITIQEVSVLGFCRGNTPTDNHSKVERLARIQGITRETALSAARLEAMMKDTTPESPEQRTSENKRRKWDCFHIATAIELKCGTLYTCDPGMLVIKERLGISELSFSHPRPRNLSLPGML